MFTVKDSNGQEIFIKDKVSYQETDDMGAPAGTASGFILCMPAEDTVQVQPIEEGSPFLCPAGQVTVTESLIQDITKLATNEEFQAYLAKIEERYEAAVKKPKSRAAAAKPVQKVVGLKLNLGSL